MTNVYRCTVSKQCGNEWQATGPAGPLQSDKMSHIDMVISHIDTVICHIDTVIIP